MLDTTQVSGSTTLMPPASLLVAGDHGVRFVYQRTLASEAHCSGIGIHSGEKMNMRLLPAEANTGIVFLRTDLKNGARAVQARWDHVVDTKLCTVVGNTHGGSVATIEHLMAALCAAGIDNVLIEIDGPEVPIMDGSAKFFVELIEMAGTIEQKEARQEIVILETVEIDDGARRVALHPAEKLSFKLDIAFDTKLIQYQECEFDLSRGAFKSEISFARTFGFAKDVEKMQKLGLMRGGRLDNAVVFDGDDLLTPGGLRHTLEPVKHKVLDAVGDLYTAGHIRGRFEGSCSGHAMNNRILRALFERSDAWCQQPVVAEVQTAAL